MIRKDFVTIALFVMVFAAIVLLYVTMEQTKGCAEALAVLHENGGIEQCQYCEMCDILKDSGIIKRSYNG